jgi:hypothetical protein
MMDSGSRLRSALLGALVLLALAGTLTHPRLDTGAAANRTVSSIFSFFDLVLVTGLMMRRRTALYGYLLNGVFVLYGTVMMAHFSVAHYLSGGGKTAVLFLNPGFDGILTLWADFFAGYVLYRLWMAEPAAGPDRQAAAASRMEKAA